MKKQVALGIAAASATLIGGWKLVRQMTDRGEGEMNAVAVAPGVPAEAYADPGTAEETPASGEKPSVSSSSSKAELYEVATGLGIEGRSKMNKTQLLEAIEAAD